MAKKKERHPILDRASLWGAAYYDCYPETVTTDRKEFFDMVLEDASKCSACPLSESRNKIALPDGEFGAKIMIISDTTSFLEDLSGIPITGPQEIKSSECNRCRNVMSCYDQRLTLEPYKRSKGQRREIICKPQPVKQDMITKPAYLYSVGSVLDGLLIKKYNGVFPRHNWVLDYERKTGELSEIRSPWFITNAVMCRSWDKRNIRDVPPDNYPMRECKKWLALFWACLEPDVIIALGRKAMGSVIGSHKRAEKIPFGSIVETKIGTVVFNTNPASILRDRSELRSGRDYGKIGKTLDIALEIAGLRGQLLNELEEQST